MSGDTFRFGAFRMDTAARQLHHDGERVNLEPRPFAVLEHLIRHRHRIVTRRELIQVVWAEPHVTPTALVRAISKVRQALRFEGEEEVIRTVSRVGYQFAMPWAAVEEHVQSVAAAAQPAVALAVKPMGNAWGDVE